MKIAVASVFFKEIELFIDSYIESLNAQTNKSFELLALFDDYNNVDILKDLYISFKIIKPRKKTTPVENREILFNFAKEKEFDVLIFGDVDDIFSPDKIDVICSHIFENDFVFHDMSIVDNRNQIISKSYYLDMNIKPLSEVKNYLSYNLIGLSNSALNLNRINEIYFCKEIIATDWWIFSNILMNNGKYLYLDKSLLNYRQHDGNLVGSQRVLNYERLKIGILVKKNHYMNLAKMFPKKLDNILNLYNDICVMERKILSDQEFCSEYIAVINKNMNNIYKGWWSEILPIKEWEKYV